MKLDKRILVSHRHNSLKWTASMCGSRGGDRGSGHPPPEKSQKIGLSSNTGPDPLKNHSYQASIQCWATIGPPAKRHLNGVLLVGRRWPAYSGSWIISLLIKLKKRIKVGPPLKNFLDTRMASYRIVLVYA